jgi:general secretion pathway protein D
MLEDQQTKSLTGIPGLAQIPILKYLFGQTNTDHSQTETVFALIPHIVREHELNPLNNKAISVGTASAIELRRVTPMVLPTETPARPTPATTPATPPAAAVPVNSLPPGTTSGMAGFGFDPPNIKQTQGATFTVNVQLNGAQNAHTVPVQIAYDPKLLQVMNVSNGGFLSQDGQAVALVHRDDASTGTLQITATRPPGANGISGQGTVLVVTFLAKSAGQGTLTISKGGTRDPGMQSVPVAGTVANVTIE